MGIFIAVAMAGSLIAAGFMYMDPDQLIEPIDPNTIFDAQPQQQNFEISFQTTVLSEIGSIRVAAETDSLNKNDIDITIRSLENVSRVGGSRFVTHENGWFYLAEIDLRNSENINETINEILALEFFNGDSEVMKRVTISVPEETTLYNSAIDLERRFVFPYQTSVALVQINTLSQDTIFVEGTISLQGNNIISLELLESENLTTKGENYFVSKTFLVSEIDDNLFFEGSVNLDTNTEFFENRIEEINSDSYIVFFEMNEIINFFGQSKIENFEEINNLFSEFLEVEFFKSTTFELNEIFVPELNEIVFLNENNFSTQIPAKTNIGDEVTINLMININRDFNRIVQATIE